MRFPMLLSLFHHALSSTLAFARLTTACRPFLPLQKETMVFASQTCVHDRAITVVHIGV
jgi:hypothetical protein